MKNTDLYSLFELSPVPMWTFDVKTLRFLDVNLAATTNYGYSRDEFLSMSINQIRPDDDITWVRNIVRENFRTGSFYQNTFRHIRKCGKMIYVDIASNLIKVDGRDARLVLATDITEKLEAQQALFLSEQRFRALVQDGSDMITILDTDFRYKYVSPASARVFGMQPELFIGKEAFEFVHRDDREVLEHEAARIWDERSIQLSPYRYRDHVGRWLWIETRATNLFDDPAVKGIVCTSRNVTERILDQQLVQENIERFKIVSKATSDIIWDCDLVSETIVWNRAIKGILKFIDKERTTSAWWIDQIHPEDRQRVITRLDRHIEQGITKWEDEYRFRCGDGSYRHIFDRGFVLMNDKGHAYRMIGSMQDITKRKEEEKWSKMLESVVVNTSDGVLVTDGSYRPVIIYVNDALVEMSGFSKQELIGRTPDMLHAHHTGQIGLKRLKAAVKKQHSCKVELVNYTRMGKRYDVSISLTPIFSEEGKLSSWISIQRDVSEQRRYMEEIEAHNKNLNEISWMQSHVARAPLARIMSLIELLETCGNLAERMELMGYLKTSAVELDEIINAIANRKKIDAQANIVVNPVKL